MTGYWRGSGGQDETSEPERPERLGQQGDRRHGYGHIDGDKISTEDALAFLGHGRTDRVTHEGCDEPSERLDAVSALAASEEPEAGQASEAAEGEQPEQTRLWRTIAEETVEAKSHPSYSAAKRDLGSVPETELHHVVEQAQAKPERSGFSVERINSTDNLVRLPEEFHREISAHYSSKPLGYDRTVRDALSGQSWDDQYEYGRGIIDDLWRERRDDA